MGSNRQLQTLVWGRLHQRGGSGLLSEAFGSIWRWSRLKDTWWIEENVRVILVVGSNCGQNKNTAGLNLVVKDTRAVLNGIPYWNKFSRGLIFAQIRAIVPKCAKINPKIIRREG